MNKSLLVITLFVGTFEFIYAADENLDCLSEESREKFGSVEKCLNEKMSDGQVVFDNSENEQINNEGIMERLRYAFTECSIKIRCRLNQGPLSNAVLD